MKKIIKYIAPLLLLIAFLVTGCENEQENLNLSGGVKILSLKISGVDGDINEKKGEIEFYLPWSKDLKRLTPEIVLSEGATVAPSSGAEVDLSAPVKFRVINNNRYNDYNVVVSYPQITSFAIGKFAGRIDNKNGTILVRYPITEDVTALSPTIEVTKGATINPQSGKTFDFTDPVDYKISYMGETFTYTVTVQLVEMVPVAFLGTTDKASSITNADEKAAYEWFSQVFYKFEYISFDQIKNGKDLSHLSLIWWHCDGDSQSLPMTSNDPTVLTALKSYYKKGGSFFFSSWATQYAAVLDIPKNGKGINNMWGGGNTPTVTDKDWGICFTGHELHPAFAGLQKPAGVNNKAYLLGKGVKAKGHNAIWSFADWTEYPFQSERWAAETGAINLASFHWDNTLTERSVMFEYPKANGHGGTICIGNEAYDWFNEDGSIANVYKGNIETLTQNIISYLSN